MAWALTYLLHSTLLIVAAWALGRTPWGRAPRAGDAIWKCALVGALVTATLHQALGATTSLAVPMWIEAPGGAIAGGGPGPAAGLTQWVALAWAAVSCLAAGRLARGWFQLRRAAGRRRVLSSGPLRRELDAILEGAGVTHRVTLSCSRGLIVPRAIGTGEICIPVRVLRDLSAPEQRALLAHETAHLLRHDGAWLFAAALLQTVGWWQPLTRIAVARLRHSMELCCDDWAASRVPDRMALAECLVKVGEWGVRVPRGVALAAFTVHGSPLRERVERLIDPDRLESRAARGPWLAAALLLAVLALAPRVTLAVAGPASPAAATSSENIVVPAPAAPAGDLRPAVPARRRAPRPVARPLQQVPLVPSTTPGLARIEGPVQAIPATETSSIITMPEPLLRSSPSSMSTSTGLTRAATAAARSVVPAPARPPLVGKDDLLTRVGTWLEFQRRTPSFDPLYPKYDRQD